MRVCGVASVLQDYILMSYYDMTNDSDDQLGCKVGSIMIIHVVIVQYCWISQMKLF